MEIKKVTGEMREKLREPLPSEAVSPHPTKTYLSTIKSIYVTERLNEVFGVGSWKLRSISVEKVDKMVVIQTRLTIEEYGIDIEQYGGNDNADLGDAYKGAVTDAITKIGSYLEIGIDVFKGKGDKKPPAKKVAYSNTGENEKLYKETDLRACDKCGKSFVIKEGKFGSFYGCSGYPDCKRIINASDAHLYLK